MARVLIHLENRKLVKSAVGTKDSDPAADAQTLDRGFITMNPSFYI